MNIDQIMIKVETLRYQLEHHSNYFENRWWDVLEKSRDISEKKLELEYLTYHKVLNNLSEEVKEIEQWIMGNSTVTPPHESKRIEGVIT